MVRKTVTVLFADVTGFTAIGERLDPEVLRRVMTQYFDVARATLERHGATVEKFIGDAVMAVFGLPVVHEDDAVRAARAALELRREVAETGLVLRIGVNTGEVVAAEGETLVTGDAVNVAARLEQAAAADEILFGDATYRLAHNALRVEAHAPVEVKGRRGSVAAWSLVGVREDVPAVPRRLDAPFVGRAHELAVLAEAFARVEGSRAAQRVTLLGAAGIGKSRLALEFLQRVDARARVVVGRCLAYGEGITYWPLAEIVRSSVGGDHEAILAAVGDELVADRLAAAIGAGGVAGTKEETQWAARRFLEALAAERPLVVVLDDLHWAERTFLDLVEYVADFAGAPILLLCAARPDLLDARPAWSAPRENALLLPLAPLDDADAETLLQDVDAAARSRILAAAEGNPLFVEQFVALRAEAGHGEPVIPPTIQALLTARIDALAPRERAVVERAAVEGRLFHRGSVVELAPDDLRDDVGAQLLSLVRKELVRPADADIPGDDAYRFVHALVRDAAYEAIAKEVRAELHERFVAWLERVVPERAQQIQEIVGYHLEQAALYRRELGLAEDGLPVRAAEHLVSAGERAFCRGDHPAAKSLLGRAVALLPAGHPLRVRVNPIFGAALQAMGEIERARAVLAAAVEEARAAGDRASELAAWAIASVGDLHSRPATNLDEIEADLARLVPEAEALGDPRTLVAVTKLELTAALMRASFARVGLVAGRLVAAARAADDHQAASEGWLFFAGSAAMGPRPVDEVLPDVRSRLAQVEGPLERAAVRVSLGGLLGMHGEFDEGRRMVAEARRVYTELGLQFAAAATGFTAANVEFAAGDDEAAARALAVSCAEFREMGETGYLSTNAALLGDALYSLGRFDEAEELTRESERATLHGDAVSEARWRCVRAKVLARRGEDEEAMRLARASIEWIETTDAIKEIGDVYCSLAEVHRLAGRRGEARAALEHALELYARKGHRPSTARVRALLAAA